MDSDLIPADTPQETQPEQDVAVSETSLAELPASLRDACARVGWSDLMPVQKKAIPYVAAGRDVMVQARTGSGKTGAFVLPLIEKLDLGNPACQALVLVPTRELAQQVAQEAKALAGESGFKTVAVYGGTGYKAQLEALKQGAQLVVGTPGRILDYLDNRQLFLDGVRIIIFDEADRMLSVGFYPDMKKIQRFLPRRLFGAFMFSATFPPSVLRLAESFLHKPDLLSLSGDQVHVAHIEHAFVKVDRMGKEHVLIRLIEVENPTLALIFCNTKSNVHYVTEILKQYGFDAEELSSDISQAKREKVLAGIKAGDLRFLVATDVAARGIDIPELSHVFLFEPPEDPESYIHRAGRTGRAGASGTVISLVDVVQQMTLNNIGRKFSIEFIERPEPGEEEVVKAIEERVTALLESRRREFSQVQRRRLDRFMPSCRKFAQDEESLELLAMLLDDFYQRELLAPPPAPEPKEQLSDAKRLRRKRSRKKPSDLG